jgi:CRP-like cAMP-binding protein
LPADTIAQLAEHAAPASYRPGEVLFRRGAASEALYVVMVGQVRLEAHSPAGPDHMVSILGPGDAIGELSLFDAAPLATTAEAVGEVQVLVLPHQAFRTLVAEDPEAMWHLLARLAGRLREATETAADAALLDFDERLARVLDDLAEAYGQPQPGGVEIDAPLTPATLAALVGCSRETVDRLLVSFEARGDIRRHGDRIALLGSTLGQSAGSYAAQA